MKYRLKRKIILWRAKLVIWILKLNTHLIDNFNSAEKYIAIKISSTPLSRVLIFHHNVSFSALIIMKMRDRCGSADTKRVWIKSPLLCSQSASTNNKVVILTGIIKSTLRLFTWQILSVFNFRLDTPSERIRSGECTISLQWEMKPDENMIRNSLFVPCVCRTREVISRKEAAGFARVIPKNKALLWVVLRVGARVVKWKSLETHFSNDTRP